MRLGQKAVTACLWQLISAINALSHILLQIDIFSMINFLPLSGHFSCRFFCSNPGTRIGCVFSTRPACFTQASHGSGETGTTTRATTCYNDPWPLYVIRATLISRSLLFSYRKILLSIYKYIPRGRAYHRTDPCHPILYR